LVELMIVVVIIGLLAAMAIPAFQRVQQATLINRAVNDFRVFSQGFESYNSLNGGWPPNASPGAVPSGMSKDFKEDTWAANPNVIGGRWNWDINKNGIRASLSVSGFNLDDDQLTKIDARLDDGNLSTGLVRKFSDRVSYILEE
jgi:type IV pilus assembly protein PilA